jgi:hypothetical protein
MATEQKAPPEVDNCHFLLQGQAKNLADRLYGPEGPPPLTTFAQLEDVALNVAGSLRTFLLEFLLARQAEAFHQALPPALQPCPVCARQTLARDPEARLLHGRAGVVEWLEPHRYCAHCRKAYFPQSKSLGLDQGRYSIALLDLICYAGANKPSFREASGDLLKMSGIAVHEKQVERLSRRIGVERLAERAAQVERFCALPLVQRCDDTPAGALAPGQDQVAVIMADAGMLQLRDLATSAKDDVAAQATLPALSCATGPPGADADPADLASVAADDDEGDDEDKPPSGRHWREDKVGLVLTMSSVVSATDPYPEIPKTFLDPERVAKIIRGLKKVASLREEQEDEKAEQVADDSCGAATDDAAATTDDAAATTDDMGATAADDGSAAVAQGRAAPYEGPKLQTRQVVASRQSWPLFGVILASAAWLAGLAPAKRKAFVADGARAIWRVWRARFSSYEPIVDFIHVMSYVYAAARAIGTDATSGWHLYACWIVWVWQGKVTKVIEALKAWQQEHGEPEKKETSPRSVVARSLGYLVNNQARMKYAEYRRQGLPIVSSLVESMVKQISRRVKGTEKFWTEEGAEAILQLRADYLSDGQVMEHFWQRRQAAAMGQRSYRSRH